MLEFPKEKRDEFISKINANISNEDMSRLLRQYGLSFTDEEIREIHDMFIPA